MKLTGIAPWYGAKRKAELRNPILRLIGQPVVLVEPFCGSCAISLAAKADVHIVNDLHLDLFNLAMCLKDQSTAMSVYGAVNRLLFSEEVFRDMVGQLQSCRVERVPDPARAVAFLYVSWTGHNGFAGTTVEPRFNVRFSGGGGDPATRWRSVGESVPEWHQRMRTWTILNRDAFGVIESTSDREGTVLYIDSPYHRVARSDATYYHDFVPPSLFNSLDPHLRLRNLLKTFTKAKVIISHYDCEPIREMYSGPEWQIEKNTQTKSIAQAQKGRDDADDQEAPEIIITNRSVT
jgi:site-specific DNA-adenine methylase